MDPKKILKKKLSRGVEKELQEKFYKRGRDYFIDEITIGDLYKIFIKNKEDKYIMSYEDKKEIKAAYPGLFNFKQSGFGYKITKK